MVSIIDLQQRIHRELSLGFSHAFPLDPAILNPRQDVRDMCAAYRHEEKTITYTACILF